MADKISPAAADLDLFGAPVDQIRERIGRPSFAKSVENQRTVTALRAGGWSNMRIARYIGCDVKTLRKHFSLEIDAGADLVEGQALEVLVGQMRQGKLSAVKRVLEMVRAADPTPPRPAGVGAEAGAEAEAEAEEKPVKLGKKEQLALDAMRPGRGWGSRLQ